MLSAKEIRTALAELMNYIDYFERVSKLTDCNDCGKKNYCEYVPEYGGTVRINCPLWEAANKGQCKTCRYYILDPQSGWKTCNHKEQMKIKLLPKSEDTCSNWEGK